MSFRPSITLAICLLASAIAVVGLFRPADPSAPLPAGYSPDSPGAPGTPAGVSIEIVSFTFTPLDTVVPGTVIDVRNADGAAHTLTATDGSFDSGVLDGNATGAVTAPDAAGTYDFFCAIHPSMTGQLVVS